MSKLENLIKNFIEQREGVGSFDALRTEDLLDSGIIDSLDVVELSTIISTHCEHPVDLSDPIQFEAFRSIDGILNFFDR
jgi:hypothetical protein